MADMNKLHIMTILCMFLLQGSILESCSNNSVKKVEMVNVQETETDNENVFSMADEEEVLTEEEEISPIADTICIVDGRVFYYGVGETICSNMIFERNKVWLEGPTVEVFPYSDASSYEFYVRTPYKCLIVDFSDEKSLAQLSTLTAVLSSFERKTQSFFKEDSVAQCYFEVDFPTISVANAKVIRKWLTGKIVAANNDEVDGTIAAKIHNCKISPRGVLEYTGDPMDNRQIAQFAADVYFAIIEADYGDMEEDFIPTGLYQELNMRTKICNDRFVTYQQCESSYCGGTHGGFTERLVSFDHVHNQEIDNFYLFKPGYEEELADLLVEEARKSPYYQKTELDIRASLANKDEEGNLIGDYTFPRPGLSEEGVVFSFQPYDISCFADGAFHFVIPYEKVKHLLTNRAKWCLGLSKWILDRIVPLRI